MWKCVMHFLVKNCYYLIDDKTDEVSFLLMGRVQTHMDTCIILMENLLV